jgi:hypothetical protein
VEPQGTTTSWWPHISYASFGSLRTGSACLGPLRVANRMLSFAYKRFDGVVPEPGPLDDED